TPLGDTGSLTNVLGSRFYVDAQVNYTLRTPRVPLGGS
ncbi:MAG: hypothetical protein QOG57_2289, partial [Pseudonocardiales bacterium]|nr:hypothetical protein [Pseudonocardiales bacterium]